MTAIGDARANFYGGSLEHLLAEDRLFTANDFVTALANGASYYIGVTVGPTGAGISGFTIEDRSDQTELEFYEGGTYSGGTVLELFNINRRLNRNTNPFTDVSKGVTIDTPGLRIQRKTVLGSTDKKNVTSTRVIGTSLKENTVYYIHVRNDDATSASAYDINIVFSG